MEGYYLLSYSALEFITTFNPDRVLELLQENQRLRSDLESAKDLADDYNEEIVASHARLAAVEKQHLPRYDLAHPKHGSPICDGCGGDEEGWAPPWPCPTVTAVRGE